MGSPTTSGGALHATQAVLLCWLCAAAGQSIDSLAVRGDPDYQSVTVERGPSGDLRPVEVNDPMCGRAPKRHYEKVDIRPGVLAPTGTRIVGGNTAERGKFPWLVGVSNYFSKTPFCGGAIINERYVITAAHCVRGRTPITLAVLVNKHKRAKDENQIRFALSKIIREPGYSRKTYTNDIALLQLKESLRELMHHGQGVRPICIPTARCGGGSGPACFLDRTVTVAGWGSLAQNDGAPGRPPSRERPTELQYVRLPVVPNALCKAQYARRKITVNDKMMCAAANGRDTCQGDSGGPMILETGPGVFTLSGVVSFGIGCASPDYSGVYARISEFSDWIIQTSKLENINGSG